MLISPRGSLLNMTSSIALTSPDELTRYIKRALTSRLHSNFKMSCVVNFQRNWNSIRITIFAASKIGIILKQIMI
jgi:hypothetical protein